MNNTERSQSWVSVAGINDLALAKELSATVDQWIQSGKMPPDDVGRVSDLSTLIASGSLSSSPKRLELLRGLCHLYSAEIRAEKISSHRAVVGPIIVFIKKILFRMISTLLGPTFKRQREFNASVIQLLGDLCNEHASSTNVLPRK